MDKLKIFKSAKTNFRDHTRLSRSYRQAQFEDQLLANHRKAPFEHSWSMLSHMHDLRVWTLAYAPSQKNNMQRMQEIHQLNNEMWFMVYNALWKRLFIAVGLWIFINRIAKDRYLNHGMTDT